MLNPRSCQCLSQRQVAFWLLDAAQKQLQRYLSGQVLDQTTSYLRNLSNGAEIFLVGTAHISEKSAQQVEEMIKLVKPTTVMVELDAKRAEHLMSDKSRPDPIRSAIQRFLTGGSTFNLTAEVFRTGVESLYSFMKQSGLQPGKEMKVAIEEAKRIKANVVYGDKDVESTVQNIAKRVSIFDLPKLLISSSRKVPVDLDLAEVQQARNPIEAYTEALKNRRYARLLLDYMRETTPEIVHVLIDERDEHMTQVLRGLKGRVVAVVGLAHMDGIERQWQKFENYDKDQK